MANSVPRLLAVALVLGAVQAQGGSNVLPRLPGGDGSSARLTALTTDGSGAPVLAWVQAEGGPAGVRDRLHAARWTGGRWQPLGGVLNENVAHNAAQLSAQRGPDGAPWLGWSEDAGTAHVDSYLISRWDGGAWSTPATYAERRNLSDAGRSRAFAVRPDGVPFLVWTNIYFPGASAAVVQPFRWTGTRWDKSAPPLNHSLKNNAFFPSVAVGADGTQYAAWLEGNVAHSDVDVASQKPGGSWNFLGAALNVRPRTYTFAPQLRERGGVLVATWLEDRAGIDTIFVKRWNGTAWTLLGGALNIEAAQLADRPALALDGHGWPLVAWAEGAVGARRVYAKRWTGRTWTLLGGGPLNIQRTRDAFSPSVTVDGAGHPVVSWCEGSPRARVVVQRF